MSTLHIVLLVLTVVALLSACLAFAGKWPWSLNASVILTCVVLILLLSGCGSAERNGDTMTFRIRHAGAACTYRFLVDGEALHFGKIAECPKVPVCEEP